ncbi:MAG: hypothetical protein ACK4TA_11405 [Saprospiraceae bacterium]
MNQIFTICLILVSFTLEAQKNFVEGSITTLQGETINGKIDYREWVKTPREIRFQRSTTPGKIETFTYYDIAGFKIQHNKEEYIRTIVGINKEPIESDKLLEFETTEANIPQVQLDIDTVFLLILVKGRVNLYFLEDPDGKQHYFIQKGNGAIEPLIFRRVILRNPNSQTDLLNTNNRVYGVTGMQSANYQEINYYNYREQLFKAMPDCLEINFDISRSLYSYSLTKLVKRYNECVNELTYIKAKDRASTNFYFYTGVNQPFIKIKDAYNNPPNALSTAPGISVGTGLEIGIIRSNNRLSIALEANYARSSSQTAQNFTPIDGQAQTLDYDIDLWGLRFNALLKYVLYKGKIMPYVKGGVGKSSYSTARFVRTETLQTAPFTSTITERALITSELHGIIGLGVKVNNFFLESRFESGNDINSVTGEDLEMTRLSVLAGYALPLNK